MMKHEMNEKNVSTEKNNKVMKSAGLEELLNAIAAVDSGIPIGGIRVRVKKIGGDELAKDDHSEDTPAEVGSKEQESVTEQSEKPTVEKEATTAAVPPISIRIKNLHIHMDERMTSNYGSGFEPDAVSDEDTDDNCGHSCSGCNHSDKSCDQISHACFTEDDEDDDPIDFDEMIEYICRYTGLCERIVLAVLAAQIGYLDTVFNDEEDKA